MNRRFLNLLAVTSIGVAWLAGCNDDGVRTEPSASVSTEAAPTITTGADTTAPAQWLYVMEATGGDGGDGTITLRGLNPYAISFTDRPARLVRRIPVETVVSSWADFGFTDDPPNASLAFDRDGDEQVQTVTLTNPVLDADELTFSYTPLTDEAPLVVGEPTDELPAQFGPVSLFIDASDAQEPGTLTMSSITQDQFNAAAQQAKGGAGGCTTVNQVELCSLVDRAQDQLTWTAVAQLPSDPTSSVSMMAAAPAWESVAVAHGLDPLVELEWTSPTIPTPGAGQTVTLRVVVTPASGGPIVTMTCVVREAQDSSYCFGGR